MGRGILMLILTVTINGSVVAQPDTSFYNMAHIAGIDLQNLQGENVRINEQKNKLDLFVFISPECPLSRNYTKTLKEIQVKHGSSLNIHGIVSGRAYTLDEVRKFADDYSINFSLYIDPEKTLTGYLKATVTPEVVLLEDEGTVAYRGAIDDWAEELGRQKIRPSKMYLLNAINSLENNQAVLVKFTTPKGCLINEY